MSHGRQYNKLRSIALAALDEQAGIDPSAPLYKALRATLAAQDELVKSYCENMKEIAEAFNALYAADNNQKEMIRLQIRIYETTLAAITKLQRNNDDSGEWWKN